MTKLGLIAGGGALPLTLAEHCQAQARPFYIIRLAGFADPALTAYDGDEASMGEIGRIIRLARGAGCQALCLAGGVRRPDFSNVKLDMKGMAALPGIIAAGRQGDEGLLRHLTGILEKEGFTVEGAHEVMGDLELPLGALGRHAPGPEHEADIAKALDVARAIGAMDVGQGAVVCDGLVLALEAQEGTDAMLARVGTLPIAVRGEVGARRGVLVKIAKPIQEDRVDLPTIGVATIEGLDRAGLAGVVGVAGKMLVLDRDAVAKAADAAGVFVAGVTDAPG
jgi:UDP-2,3-diacylglucosamine hydrolase